jgi:NTF2-related export protein 1/2
MVSSAAEKFVESYYAALQSSRATMSFYSPPSAMPDGKPLPAIVFNGNIISDAAAFQAMFEKQMPPAHYEVQSYDCHVLNQTTPLWASKQAQEDRERT